MSDDLAPQYDPRAIEAPLYARWREQGLFHVAADAPGEPYVIQMPPPNVTAVLHAGHGLNNTIQDVLIRFQRMRGRKALWVPGTDHAGIATQNVVEKQLAAEGRTRFDIGRDAFVERVWHFVGETGGTILRQLEALGASCDWDRTYFTLDEDLSRAVREVFVTLHEQGLVYRGKYIINWCPRCLTALSNEEAEKEEVDGKIWHLRYPLADGSGSLVVATTRPETMLGDTAVAVHPTDPRYRDLIGRELALPLTDRTIPIIADEAVEADFGSGAVKVTPAHDPTDFEIGRRHGLPQLDVMTDDAHLNDSVPAPYRGLERLEARRQVVAAFEALGLLVKVEPHRHAVGHCYRCGTVVEPRLSDQWFVRMAPLAAPALAAYRERRLRFLPERQGENYAQWLEGIRDWCISRQLWWGHRIPVWYCDAEGCGQTTVARETPTACPGCAGPVRQDEDVLDTWFSSWLVPFSSLGWPEETDDLRAFYPGHTLVTAPEILFFWVARMIMAGLHFRGALPFDTVYLHGTVRDTQHRKMSKSLGNGIDPLEVIERYGADALRYTLVSGMAVGTDVILDPADLESSFAPGRNFANKLWNIGRFLLGHLGPETRRLDAIPADDLTLADRWILARAAAAVREATEHYERYRLNDAASTAYHFLWSDVADWYLEAVKPRLYGTAPGGEAARAVAAHVFELGLRLLHPVMPFITETLWLRLPQTANDGALLTTPWPEATEPDGAAAAQREFAALQAVVAAVRALRAEYGVAPGRELPVLVTDASDAVRAALAAESETARRLAKLESIAVVSAAPAEPGGTVVLEDGTTVIVPLGDLVDLDRECARLGAEAERLDGLVAGQERKLANEQFTARAPAAVVEKEREKLESWRAQAAALREKRAALGCPG
ncbi:MAG: valine--tRNA ligase [Gemmatimonadetes bacterium]|nr:valine--tRNA ligase [Gemmatimonadota bacterium]HPF61894.1 valine--tRNA ligase [Gemmatimonadales bacterium]HRX18601.1 valine--tRNA ligase [Gemmatimonadales bacterium]